MQKTQKKLPIEVEMVQKLIPTIGHTFMFPEGSKVFIQKKVIDPNENKSVYQGTFYHPKHKTSVDVSFDAVSGEHSDYSNPVYDSKGLRIADQYAYNIKIDLSAF
jgi:hypothetical protein